MNAVIPEDLDKETIAEAEAEITAAIIEGTILIR